MKLAGAFATPTVSPVSSRHFEYGGVLVEGSFSGTNVLVDSISDLPANINVVQLTNISFKRVVGFFFTLETGFFQVLCVLV